MTPTLRNAAELAAAGMVPDEAVAELDRVASRYAVAVPPAFAALIEPGRPDDPIARQVVPSLAELHDTPEERADPIGDGAHAPVPGIVHRYPDRVLFKVVHVCPVYCRFCFRREVVGPGPDAMLSAEAVEGALRYIAERPAIWEVILTGGDPLMLSPRRIAEIFARLGAMPHVKIVRLHTRVPVAAPDRVSPALVEALRAFPRSVYVALHANHPREFVPPAVAACARLIDAGIPMVSQSVLLRGVNDDVGTLGALMRAFVEARVKPYYLHHGDLAPGTSHFRVSLTEGQRLVEALRGTLSGLCQPTYVVDLPGGHGKVVASRPAMTPRQDGRFAAKDRHGVTHLYPPGPDTLSSDDDLAGRAG